MYGEEILCVVSKVPFDILHKRYYSYIETCVVYLDAKIKEVYEVVNVFETPPSFLKCIGL